MTKVFVADDHSVAVSVLAKVQRTMIRHCRQARRRETGGILIGQYTGLGDRAIISEATGPPRDSIAGPTSFIRGIYGLQQRIDRAWRQQKYYLGEWHFHPLAPPVPSDRDRTQIMAFSSDPAYQCPEPILLVVGGDPAAGGEMAVAVVLNGTLRELGAWVPHMRGEGGPDG